MTFFEAIILAVVQGATEFLPVSSSGHVALIGRLLGIPRVPLDFVVAVHFGTLLSVIVYYRRDLWMMLRSVLPIAGRSDEERGELRLHRRLVGLLLLATAPAGIAGYLLEDTVERAFGNVTLVGGALVVTALALAACARLRGEKGMAGTTWKQALVVGVAQAMALPPGMSRSGLTIAGGLAVGLRREWAPRFAFLLSVPIILGGSALELHHMLRGQVSASFDPALYAGATLVAAIAGYLAIIVVTDSVKRGNLLYFGAYCLTVGLAAIVWGAFFPA